MTSAASNYHESSQFIHQRYDDTSHVIFQQQQKIRQDEKRRAQQSNNLYPKPLAASLKSKQPLEFNRYGNQGVVAKETEARNPKPVANKEKPSTRPPSSPTVSPGGTVKSSVCILT